MPNEILLNFVSEYRSIKSLSATTLPELSVISGPNGCGKTQLLEAISSGAIRATDTNGVELSSTIFHSIPQLVASHVTYTKLEAIQKAAADTRCLIEDLESCLTSGLETNVVLHDRWVPVTRMTLMQSIIWCLKKEQNLRFNSGDKENFENAVFTESDNASDKRARWEAFKQFVPVKEISSLTEFYEKDIKAVIYDFVQYQNFMKVDMSVIFYRYFDEQQNNAYRLASGVASLDDVEFIAKYEKPPWDEVNSLLEAHGFYHRVVPPNPDEDPKVTKGYIATFINSNDEVIAVDDLSSGEKVIIAFLLSAYATQQKQNKIFQVDVPEIILFDEPDAHLHPSMTRMMFDVLQTSIIGKLSSRVIITTHSPSTVALSPQASTFKLTSGPKHHLELVDSATACRDLSEGFVQVMDGSQIVIVEGEDDPLFYRAVERALRSKGELAGTPALHFIPASQKDNSSYGGGALAAEDWANKLKEAQLPNIHALLDKDNHRKDNGSIKVLRGRYAIENFVLDPLSLAVALITDQRLAQLDNSLAVKFPQVSSISDASEENLQELVNKICAHIETHTPCLATTTPKPVSYLFGQNLNVPSWVCEVRGKDLVGYVREAFKKIDSRYIITRKDAGEYDLELGYLLKLWSQHPSLFPTDISVTLNLLRP